MLRGARPQPRSCRSTVAACSRAPCVVVHFRRSPGLGRRRGCRRSRDVGQSRICLLRRTGHMGHPTAACPPLEGPRTGGPRRRNQTAEKVFAGVVRHHRFALGVVVLPMFQGMASCPACLPARCRLRSCSCRRRRSSYTKCADGECCLSKCPCSHGGRSARGSRIRKREPRNYAGVSSRRWVRRRSCRT